MKFDNIFFLYFHITKLKIPDFVFFIQFLQALACTQYRSGDFHTKRTIPLEDANCHKIFARLYTKQEYFN